MRQVIHIPRAKLLGLAASAIIAAWSSIWMAGAANASDLLIPTEQEVPILAKAIEKQYSDLSGYSDTAAARKILVSILGDIRILRETAKESILGDLETLQRPRRTASDALKHLFETGISEDSVLLKLVEISSQRIAGGLSGAELIEETVDLSGYLDSISSSELLRRANLSLAEAFAHVNKPENAIRYLLQMVTSGEGHLDADSVRRLSTNLATVIVQGDISVLRELVLSIESGRPREAFLAQVGQNALQETGLSEVGVSIRLDMWNAALTAKTDMDALSSIVQSALDKGEDDLAAILSQTNAGIADDVLSQAISRRIDEGYAIRALRILRFVSDDGMVSDYQRRIASAMAVSGYDTMASALVPGSSGSDKNGVAPLQLDSNIAALASSGDYEGAMAGAHNLPASVRASSMMELARVRTGKGDLQGAAAMVRAIPDYSIRVKIFRDMAERAAAQLDNYGLLKLPGAGPTPELQLRSGMKEFQQVVGVHFNWARAKNLKDQRPSFHIPEIDADSLLGAIPPIAPGTSSMVLARYNKRIGLTGASTTDEIGVFGANIREYLFEAQGSVVPAVLMVDSGVHSLADLVQTATMSAPNAIVAEGDAFRISIPIFVRPGATLVLSGLEAREYRLDTKSGAFIMNSGTLIIADTTLLAFDYENARPDHRSVEQQHRFRPFITSWSGSITQIAHAQIKNLGYFGGRSYGVSLVSDPAYIRDKSINKTKPTGAIVDSTFENLLYGFYSYEADDVTVVGNEYRDNIIYGLDPHDRSNRLLAAYNTAYGSVEKHGGIISREVDDSLIVGNLTFSNTGAGLMVERNSVGNIVYANTSFSNGGDGIAIYESPCNLVQSNDAFKNGNAGVKVRNSWSVLVRSNHLHNNVGAGLEVAIADLANSRSGKERDLESDPFSTYAELDARRNLISANKAGILAKGVSRITLEGNVMRAQTPDTYAGDLRSYRAQLIRPDLGAVEADSTCVPARPANRKCSLETAGLVGSSMQQVSDVEQSAKFCTEQAGSLQESALTENQAKVDTK
jgi:parallel beta-helix repeat protein